MHTFSRIDLLFVSLPSWRMVRLRAETPLHTKPEACFNKRLSDHGPIGFLLTNRPKISPERQPLPPEILRHPAYRAAMRRIMTNLNRLTLVGSSTRYHVHLRIIRIAADYARSVMMAESYSAYTSQLVLTSCARAISDRDTRLAVGLMAKHAEAAKHLEIHAGRPRLIDPHFFCPGF